MKKLCKQYWMQIFLIIYGILTFPVFYSQIENGLDPSWLYALNKLTAFDNVKFGTDVVFTYGPVGFLAGPMYINGNFLLGTLIYIAMWTSTLILFYKLLKKRGDNIYRISLSLLVMFFGNPAFTADLYVECCVLMALAVLWIDMTDIFAAAFLVAAATIAFFFKFSIAIAIIGAFVCFLAAKILLKEFERIWILLLPCATIPASYLLYNPSLRGFLLFVKGSWEVSKGFNVAISISQYNRYVVWIFLLMSLYIAIMVSQIVLKKQKNFFVMLWLAPCFFMAYKHGFVRADLAHMLWGYIEILAMFSILILLFDTEGLYDELLKKTRRGVIQASLIVSLFLVTLLDYDASLNHG